MSLQCVTVKLNGHLIFKSKKYGDKFIFEKPDSGMFNVFMGERYFHHFGVLKGKNPKTGDYAEIHMKPKPFFGTADSKCSGFIKNSRGETKYEFEADWKSHINIIDARTKRKVDEIKKVADLPKFDENYGMPLISRNGNYLTVDTIKSICPTDARFRADIRAAEYGDFDLACEEKDRLEEFQFERFRRMKEDGVEWKPKWFEEVFDEDIGKKLWIYKGGYFEARKKGDWKGIDKIY